MGSAYHITNGDADLNHVATCGVYPLVVTACKGDLEVNLAVASALIHAGALVDKPCCNGRTPLYAACESGHIRMAQLLLSAGAVVDAPLDNGCTALWQVGT